MIIRFIFCLLLGIVFNVGIARADGPDRPNTQDGLITHIQILSESICFRGHPGPAGFASSPAVVNVIPPSLRPSEDAANPGYRIFIACPEGYLLTAIWNPATSTAPTPAPNK